MSGWVYGSLESTGEASSVLLVFWDLLFPVTWRLEIACFPRFRQRLILTAVSTERSTSLESLASDRLE